MITATIEGFAVGDTLELERTYTTPSGYVTTTAWLTVKRNVLESGALIEKRITTIQSSHGIIESGTITFFLDSNDTRTLYPYTAYVYDMQLTHVGDIWTKIETLEMGTLQGSAEITYDGI